MVAKGGRPAKPSALKLLHGDFEKNPQRKNKKEPTPKQGKPVCPRHLQGEAKKAWTRTVKFLDEMGVIAKCDADTVEQYSLVYQQFRIAVKDVQENGSFFTVVDSAGNEIRRRNPADVAMLEYARVLHRLLAEFGLTPSSRTRIQIDQDVESRNELARKYLA